MSLDILKTKIESIYEPKQLKHIFKIIYENDEHYIFNECGVFIPMDKLKPETIEKIDNYIKNIKTNVTNIEALKHTFQEPDHILNLSQQEKRIYKKYILRI